MLKKNGVTYNLNGQNGFLNLQLHFATKRRQLFLLVPARRILLVWFLLAPGSRHIMPISALLMFVPGGRPARRLGFGRLSAGSQRISCGIPSRRRPLCRCRDTF